MFIHFIGSYQENNLSPAAPFTQIIHQKEIHYPVVKVQSHLIRFVRTLASAEEYMYLAYTVKVTYTNVWTR